MFGQISQYSLPDWFDAPILNDGIYPVDNRSAKIKFNDKWYLIWDDDEKDENGNSQPFFYYNKMIKNKLKTCQVHFCFCETDI